MMSINVKHDEDYDDPDDDQCTKHIDGEGSYQKLDSEFRSQQEKLQCF